MDTAVSSPWRSRPAGRRSGEAVRPLAMIVLRLPKGLDGPSELHGKKTGGLLACTRWPLPRPNKDPEPVADARDLAARLRPTNCSMRGT